MFSADLAHLRNKHTTKRNTTTAATLTFRLHDLLAKTHTQRQIRPQQAARAIV